MTDEQIKQAAYEYINSDAVRPENMQLAFGDFIAGAHSRDEEIDELKGKIERQKAIISVDDLNEKALRKELDQLRNPWISVEDDTPKISTKKGSFSSEHVFVRIVSEDGMVYHGIGSYYVRDKSWCIRNERDSVTHWMPIPKIEKGE